MCLVLHLTPLGWILQPLWVFPNADSKDSPGDVNDR